MKANKNTINALSPRIEFPGLIKEANGENILIMLLEFTTRKKQLKIELPNKAILLEVVIYSMVNIPKLKVRQTVKLVINSEAAKEFLKSRNGTFIKDIPTPK